MIKYNAKLLIVGLAIVGIWRGAWMIMDTYLGTAPWTAWFTLISGIIILSLLNGEIGFA